MNAPGWFPRNPTEHAMAEAIEEGDGPALCRALLTAELYLPQVPAEGVVVTEDTAQWSPLVTDVDGTPAIPVFTALAAMAAQVAVPAYAETSVAEVRDRWAEPGWLLLVNPGSPIEVSVPVSEVEVLARGEHESAADPADAAPADEAAPIPEREAGPDRVLHDPSYHASTDEYVAALLDALVIAPTTREADFPDELLEPGFPWRVVTDESGQPTIEVFTDPVAFDSALPGSPYVRMPFLLLMIGWPDGHALSVNPTGPVGMVWPAEQMRKLQQRAITE